MDTGQITRIRSTWAAAAEDSPAVARAFYANLFRMAPETERLFSGDMEVQGGKLMATLGFVVEQLEAPDTLLPAARDLAIRHVAYGVEPAHYGKVGAALLATFDELMGESFTEQDRAAWAEAYGGLSDYMIAQVS